MVPGVSFGAEWPWVPEETPPSKRMALSNTVSQKAKLKRKAPRSFLKGVFKRQKPHLRLEARVDLLVRFQFSGWECTGCV